MLNKALFIFRYIRYYITAQTKYDIHSPFVFDLLTDVIENNYSYYPYKPIETLRTRLLLDDRTIDVTDFGAGSALTPNSTRSIAAITKHSAKPAKYGQLLFRLVNRFQPQTMLELGTSLGISTLYQAAAFTNARLVTMEGCVNTAAIAKENFQQLKMQHIEMVTGNFDNTLPRVLSTFSQLDYVYFDGNHQKKPTLAYFNQCLAKAKPDSVFIFDDIHWSTGMEEAWETIKQYPQVTVTIDLFFIGIVFFRQGQAKQHFTIRF